MNIEALNIELSVPLVIGGLALAAIGLLWLIRRVFSAWGWWGVLPPAWLVFPLARFGSAAAPVVLVLLGLLIASAPAAVSRMLPTDQSPRDKQVDGERHVTLTGADGKAPGNDYCTMLKDKADVDKLQMANRDVYDGTLELLAGFSKLKSLDVNNSQVTDAGLKLLAELPALEDLYVARTQITDAGVREHLFNHPTLKRLDLRETKVTAEAAKAWQDAKPGRRVMR